MSEQLLQQVMDIIAHAGEGKSLAMEALVSCRAGNYAEADCMLARSSEVIAGAHEVHRQILAQSATDAEMPVSFLLVHAPTGQSEQKGLTTEQRWEQIVDAARQMQEQYGVELVIPYGTAVENLRLTEYNDEYSLCRDNLHLGLGLARYTAAAAYYEALVAPHSGIDIEGNAYRYACSRGDWDLSSKSKPVNVTDKNVRIAWKAAAEACRSWDKLITW